MYLKFENKIIDLYLMPNNSIYIYLTQIQEKNKVFETSKGI